VVAVCSMREGQWEIVPVLKVHQKWNMYILHIMHTPIVLIQVGFINVLITFKESQSPNRYAHYIFSTKAYVSESVSNFFTLNRIV